VTVEVRLAAPRLLLRTLSATFPQPGGQGRRRLQKRLCHQGSVGDETG